MPAAKLKQKLTLKQALFIKNFIQLGNATQSVKQAGYQTKWPDRIASQLLANPIIQNELLIAREKVEKKVDVSLEWRMSILKQIANNGQDSDRIRSIAEINKMLGDYAPEKHAHAHAHINANIKDLKELSDHYYDALEQRRLGRSSED